MKKLLTTIVCLFCVLTAYAVSYGASYKGSRYSGGIYTTSSARSTSIGSGGVLASAPFASMGSTSSIGGRGRQITGLQNSSSAIVSGIRSKDFYLTRELAVGDGDDDDDDPPSQPGDCHCHWVEIDGVWMCEYCHRTMVEGCDCGDNCRCPIGGGWQVWLFMAVMAFAYAVFKKRHSLRSETI